MIPPAQHLKSQALEQPRPHSSVWLVLIRMNSIGASPLSEIDCQYIYTKEDSHGHFKQLDQHNKTPKMSKCWPVREAPFNLLTPPCGHCPNSIYTPPPALKRALWGTFFQARF